MKLILMPTGEAIQEGQHTVTIERPSDTLHVVEVIEMFVAALLAYGCTVENVLDGLETVVDAQHEHEMIGGSGEQTAHC